MIGKDRNGAFEMLFLIWFGGNKEVAFEMFVKARFGGRTILPNFVFDHIVKLCGPLYCDKTVCEIKER